ncbi:hypothetical protein MK489_19280 [Myxococcota bacterium]|nr:hypothetical protein [Myxococcota bacterium]
MQPPRVRWTFHATATVRSYSETLEWLGRICGCRALEYSDNRDPLVARKGGVTWIGDNGLELMEPNDPAGGPGRFLERFGPGLYGLALQVEDVTEAASWLESRGAGIVGDIESRFFFTKPQHTCSIYLEWADKPWSFDPRFGAELPPPPVPPRIDVPRIAFWGALVADPAQALERLGELWPAPVAFTREGVSPDVAQAAVSVCDGLLALYPVPRDPAEMESLWGPSVLRPRLHLIGLRVRDLAGAADVLADEGVRIVRGDVASGEIVTHPEDTCGLALVWTDRDLPGDPRGPLG